MTQQPANDLEAPVLVGALDDLDLDKIKVRDDVSSVMTPTRRSVPNADTIDEAPRAERI
jgi:hypothetical protein